MNALIKVTTTEQGSQVVSARELYAYLELSDSQFNRWAKSNIEDNPFAVEGTDYQRFDTVVETPNGGKKAALEYAVRLDFAKKLCMVSKSPNGEKARDYFLECERKAQKIESLPSTPAELLVQIAQQILQSAQVTAELDRRTNVLEQKMERMERIQQTAETELLSLPAPTEPMADMSTEAKIVRMVNTYAQAMNLEHAEVWRKVYQELLYRYRISVNAYNRVKGETKLQLLKRLGHLDKVFIIATNILRITGTS